MQNPERRSEPRFIVDAPATVTILAPRQYAIRARVAEMSGGGLLLMTPQPIPIGSPVRIDASDILLLGEVCRCVPGDEESRVAVIVRHSLRGLMELDRLNRALLGRDSRDAGPATAIPGRTTSSSPYET